MRRVINGFVIAAAGMMALLVLVVGSSAQKAGKPKRIHIQGQAYGTSTQLGRNVGVNIIVSDYSTAEDQKALLAAFQEKKNEGLVNALEKMNSKGRVSLTGTLGYDIVYIRKFPRPDGTVMLRMITNRPIRFGELWSDSRSTDYSLSGIEVILSPDKKKHSGTLLPACKFKIDKKGQLELELLQNPWSLRSIRIS